MTSIAAISSRTVRAPRSAQIAVPPAPAITTTVTNGPIEPDPGRIAFDTLRETAVTAVERGTHRLPRQTEGREHPEHHQHGRPRSA